MKKITSNAEIQEPKCLVRRRINLINKLNAANEQHAEDIDELINVDGKWYALPGKDYQGLRCYLLLTCFDILGKVETEWSGFYSWLAQKTNIDPHTLAPVDTEQEMSEPLKTLYHNYGKNHAMRNNFYYFLNVVITNKRRQELLDNIRILKKDKLTDEALPFRVSDEEKLKFLFDIRSSYTHKGIAIAVMAGRNSYVNNEDDITDDLNDYYIHIQWCPALFINILEEILREDK